MTVFKYKISNQIVASVWDFFKVVIVSILIVVPIRYYVFQPFFVKGASMEPNFNDGEYLIVDELSYRFKNPQRGEVVVFRYPANPKEFYIKRLIALPGETVQINDGKVFIFNNEFTNGKVLEEKYLPENLKTYGNLKIILSVDEFFLMGDNREYSYDSRRFGPVSYDMFVGRAWLVVWPTVKAGFTKNPQYSY